MSDLIDHTELALSRVATEYRASTKFLAFLQALMGQAQEIETVLRQVETIADIDASVGVQLDNIGEIVGISRYVKLSLPVAFFAFFGQPSGRGMGDEDLADLGGRFRDENEPSFSSSTLSDAQYRLFLRARIARNHTKGTIESVMAALQYIFDTQAVILRDNNDMSFDISIGKRLDFTEQTLLYLLEIIPKPAGVRINTRSYFDEKKVFGFEGFNYALGFGDENQRHEIMQPLLLEGTFNLDGSEVLDGQGVGEVVYDDPLIGGIFAEEFSITI
jgi:hypothetical protein